MKLSIEFEPEDIRNYEIAEVWTDTQVSDFIERWQQSITEALADTLVMPGGLLDDYMSDPDCLSWVTTPDNTQEEEQISSD